MSALSSVMPFVNATNAGLDDFLQPEGFSAGPLQTNLEKVRKVYWVRPRGWKHDVLTINLNRRSADALDLSLEICLAEADDLSDGWAPSLDAWIDGLPIQGILHSQKVYYFPNFFGKLLPGRAPSFARRIGRDVKRAVPWFEKYATPEQCIGRLRAGKTNWGTAEVPIQRLEDKLLKVIEDRGSAHGAE